MKDRVFMRKFPYSSLYSIMSACDAFFNEVALTKVSGYGCPIVKIIGYPDEPYEFINQPSKKFEKGRYVDNYPNYSTYNTVSYERTKPSFIWVSREDIRSIITHKLMISFRYWLENNKITLDINPIVQPGEIYIGCYF